VREGMAAPVMLIIRDGWGISPAGPEKRDENGDATLLASTPFHDKLYREYPWSKLSASGRDVGLPEGQMGNSEVGHLNLGAGRIVYQDLTRINKAIAGGEFQRNRVLQDTFAAARNHRLHLLGLVSDGGVHSHYSHMVALANAARAAGVADIFVHAFTDGRDTSPTGGADFLSTCENELEQSGARIVTVVGRYFAMDRDRRWDRTKKAWDAIVLGRGELCKPPPSAAVEKQYALGKTDEFMPPLIFDYANEQRVRDGDSVLFFNFRVASFFVERLQWVRPGGMAANPFRLAHSIRCALFVALHFRAGEAQTYFGRGRERRREKAIANSGDGKIRARDLFF
jgi:2,3-bisphosphoglycerate-independent phosphoglycerate mutase